MDVLYEFISRLPANKKQTPSGWISFNAVCCHHRGHNVDKRGRGGAKIINGTGFSAHCFNCGFATAWTPGSQLSKKAKEFLSYCGATKEEIAKINFAALKTKNDNPIPKRGQAFSVEQLQRHDLPNGAKPFSYWAENPPDQFIEVMEYMVKRNPDLLDWHDYYWTPDKDLMMHRRIIVPFINPNTNWIYGYSARAIYDKIQPKYIAQYTNGYIFGQEHLFSPHRKYVILCEGIFDAISISGCAYMKQTLSRYQLDTLRTSDKKKIILPDRDKDGMRVIEQAIKEGFAVSFPIWEKGIKDAADAVAKYNRAAVIRQIIESSEDSPLKIQIKAKTWFGDSNGND